MSRLDTPKIVSLRPRGALCLQERRDVRSNPAEATSSRRAFFDGGSLFHLDDDDFDGLVRVIRVFVHVSLSEGLPG